MIDTSAQIFLKKSSSVAPQNEEAIQEFLKLVNRFPNMPIYSDDDFDEKTYKQFLSRKEEWEQNRLAWIDNELSHTEVFNNLLDKALSLGQDHYYLSDEFEFYVGRYRSKERALAMKRARRVVGACSQDSRPREHAVEIAILSAEVVKWDIFLRAHLNILNDRFERVTDGSYAWGRRKTYVKELEDLGLDVPALLLGSGLRSSNTSENHYRGNTRRLGRAISESRDKEAFLSLLTKMIQDEELDDYNRLLMFYIYRSYLNESIPKKSEKVKAIDIQKEKLPLFMAKQIKVKR